jgi:hypothetical protein
MNNEICGLYPSDVMLGFTKSKKTKFPSYPLPGHLRICASILPEFPIALQMQDWIRRQSICSIGGVQTGRAVSVIIMPLLCPASRREYNG